MRKGKIEGIYDGVEWLIDPQTLDDFARRYLRKKVNPDAANKDKGNETPVVKGSMKIFLPYYTINYLFCSSSGTDGDGSHGW